MLKMNVTKIGHQTMGKPIVVAFLYLCASKNEKFRSDKIIYEHWSRKKCLKPDVVVTQPLPIQTELQKLGALESRLEVYSRPLSLHCSLLVWL